MTHRCDRCCGGGAQAEDGSKSLANLYYDGEDVSGKVRADFSNAHCFFGFVGASDLRSDPCTSCFSAFTLLAY
jgi:hypothetical protein